MSLTRQLLRMKEWTLLIYMVSVCPTSFISDSCLCPFENTNLFVTFLLYPMGAQPWCTPLVSTRWSDNIFQSIRLSSTVSFKTECLLFVLFHFFKSCIYNVTFTIKMNKNKPFPEWLMVWAGSTPHILTGQTFPWCLYFSTLC